MSNGDGLPKGWAATTVAGIAKSIQYGHTASATDEPNGPRFLRITDIQNNCVDWDSVPSCTISAEDIGKYCLQAGDIVFARTGATTGKSYLIRECPEAVFASYLIRLRMHDGVFPQYVEAFFQTNDYWRQIEGGKRGIGQPNVNASVLGTISLPLAPLNQQLRIVTKIEELFSDLDAGVAALERATAKLKRYRAAMLKAAVEGKLTEDWRAKHPLKETASQLLERILKERRRKWEDEQLATYAKAGKKPPANWKEKYKEPAGPDESTLPALPEGWCWATMDSLTVSGPQNGLYLPQTAYGAGVPILRIDDFQNTGSRSSGELRLVDAKSEDIERYSLRANDVVVNRVNSMTHLGKCLVIEDRNLPALFESNMMRLTVATGVSVGFLQMYLRSQTGRQRLTQNAKWAVNQASINQQDVVATPVPLPPIDEQQQIVSEVELRLSIAQESETQIEANLKRSSRLRQSILKRAFEGKLVPQDANNEPASVLLERIKAAKENGSRKTTTKPARKRK